MSDSLKVLYPLETKLMEVLSSKILTDFTNMAEKQGLISSIMPELTKVVEEYAKQETIKSLKEVTEKNHDKDFDTYDYDGIAESVFKMIKRLGL